MLGLLSEYTIKESILFELPSGNAKIEISFDSLNDAKKLRDTFKFYREAIGGICEGFK